MVEACPAHWHQPGVCANDAPDTLFNEVVCVIPDAHSTPTAKVTCTLVTVPVPISVQVKPTGVEPQLL